MRANVIIVLIDLRRAHNISHVCLKWNKTLLCDRKVRMMTIFLMGNKDEVARPLPSTSTRYSSVTFFIMSSSVYCFGCHLLSYRTHTHTFYDLLKGNKLNVQQVSIFVCVCVCVRRLGCAVCGWMWHFNYYLLFTKYNVNGKL